RGRAGGDRLVGPRGERSEPGGRAKLAFTGVHAALQESSLHAVASEREGGTKVLSCALQFAATKLELTERGTVKGIRGETAWLDRRADFFEASLGALVLS